VPHFSRCLREVGLFDFAPKFAKLCVFEQAGVEGFEQNSVIDSSLAIFGHLRSTKDLMGHHANAHLIVLRGWWNTELLLPAPGQGRCEAGPRTSQAINLFA
jgi:hypothetical protein